MKNTFLSWMLVMSLGFPLLTSCGGSQTANVPPPVDDTRAGAAYTPSGNPPAHQGLSKMQTGVLLVGAAALYYLYQHHKQSQAQGSEGQYYLSRNGRVYYRDAEHRAHYVTPPANGINVPSSEAQQYQGFQGYNNSPTGRDLTSLSNQTQ